MKKDNEITITATDRNIWIYDKDKKRWSVIKRPPDDILNKVRRIKELAIIFQDIK